MRLVTIAFLAACLQGPVLAQELPADRLAPLYRHSILVSELERSLTLYRDVLGLEVSRINETSADSYSYVFFDIEPGSMKRFAYLDGDDGRKNVLGIGEVPGLDTKLPKRPRSVAWVQTVADVEGVMEQVEALGLELVPPLEFLSREAGKPGIETGVVDWDGHLVMFYGLKREAAATPRAIEGEEEESMTSEAPVHHTINYIEISVTDMAEAKRFYNEAFDWEFNEYGPDYAGIRRGDGEAGGFTKVDEIKTGGPLVILFSENLDATLDRVKKAGGEIVVEPFDFPGGRRFHFKDSSGNELAVWAFPST